MRTTMNVYEDVAVLFFIVNAEGEALATIARLALGNNRRQGVSFSY
jgi:hypothetical protein